METIQSKAIQIGGSIAVVIPRAVVIKERIQPNDRLSMKIEKTIDLSPVWGILKDVKTPTQKIMEEIDEGETDE
ncbi:hypothetical protein HYU14_01580 [Candidatus Woesearchaeota archaeon]|nr:hypothetical protein [Candidatus Woesearchaeota archaeon]